MKRYRIGEFCDDNGQKRYIILEVEKLPKGYYWRLKFKTCNLRSYIGSRGDELKEFVVYELTNHKLSENAGDWETIYSYVSNIYNFEMNWDKFKRSQCFYRLVNDFKMLKAKVNWDKFRKLYEKYRCLEYLLEL